MSCAVSSRLSASASVSSRSWVRTASATSAGVSAPCSPRRWTSASSASATAVVMLISVNELLLHSVETGARFPARLPSPLSTTRTVVPFPSSPLAHQNLVTNCYKDVRARRKPRLRGRAVVRDECRMREGHVLGKERLDRLGVPADLQLGELRVPQGDEVHQSPGVDRPVELGVGADRDDRAGELAGDALLHQPRVGCVRLAVDGLELLAGLLGELGGDRFEAISARLSDLAADVVGVG